MKCKLQSTHIIYQSIALEVLILLNIITPFSFFAHLVWFSYDTSHLTAAHKVALNSEIQLQEPQLGCLEIPQLLRYIRMSALWNKRINSLTSVDVFSHRNGRQKFFWKNGSKSPVIFKNSNRCNGQVGKAFSSNAQDHGLKSRQSVLTFFLLAILWYPQFKLSCVYDNAKKNDHCTVTFQLGYSHQDSQACKHLQSNTKECTFLTGEGRPKKQEVI